MPSSATRKRFQATLPIKKVIEALPLLWNGQAGLRKPKRRSRRLPDLTMLNPEPNAPDREGSVGLLFTENCKGSRTFFRRDPKNPGCGTMTRAAAGLDPVRPVHHFPRHDRPAKEVSVERLQYPCAGAGQIAGRLHARTGWAADFLPC